MMPNLSWTIDKNVISDLFYEGQNIINPWGFETADSSAFFSLEKGVGWRYKVLSESYSHDNTVNQANVITQMREGLWELNLRDKVEGKSLLRFAEATVLEDSFFMDFVMRFRFKKEAIDYAQIASRKYYHRNTNVYYEYPVDEVYLQAKGYGVKISVVDSVVPSNMTPVIYVRDNYNDEWVVHVRMIPKSWDKEVIKICTSWAGTRPLPQCISRPLLSVGKIKDFLWRRGEREPYKNWLFRRFINPSAFGMVAVKRGSKLMWNVKLEIV